MISLITYRLARVNLELYSVTSPHILNLLEGYLFWLSSNATDLVWPMIKLNYAYQSPQVVKE